MEKPKYGFVYIWRDRKHNRYYIGCHWGTEDDRYICSSNAMRDAHRRRPQDFRRRILDRVDNRKDLFWFEAYWLWLIPPEELGKKYYNWCRAASGDPKKRLMAAQRSREANLGDNNPSRRLPETHWSRKPGAQAIHDKITQKRVNSEGYRQMLKTRPNNHNKGKVWITNGNKEDFGHFERIPEGWRKGRMDDCHRGYYK